MPDQQDEKRAILETMAFLVPPPARRRARRPTPPRRSPRSRRLETALAASAGKAGDARLAASEAQSARRARPSCARRSRRRRIRDTILGPLQTNVVGSLPEQLDELVEALSPDVVTLETLPPELREMMIADDGRARVTVIPKKDLNDSANLEEFVDGVLAVAPNGHGSGGRARSSGDASRRAR